MRHAGLRTFDDSDEDDVPITSAATSLKRGGGALRCPRCGRADFGSVSALSAHATRCRVGQSPNRPKRADFVSRDVMAHNRFGLHLHMKKAEMAEDAKKKKQSGAGAGAGAGATSVFGRSNAYWEDQTKKAKSLINKPLSKTVEQALENARLKRIADKVGGEAVV